MITLKEIKESNKSIVLYNEEGYLILTDKNVQTDEIVMEYINKAADSDIIEVYEDEEIITVVLQTMEVLQMKEREQQLIEILTDRNVTEEGKENVYDDFLRDFPFYDSSKLDRYFL